MPALLAYLNEKNSLAQKGYKLCIEFIIDKSDPSPANWLYYRKAQYNLDLVVHVEQLGNPGVFIDATFEGGSPIGDIEEIRDLQNETPTMQLTLPNAARELESITEFYDLSLMLGRALWVHPDHTSDGAAVESDFQIQGANSVGEHGILIVSPYTFDRNTTMLPRTQVTVKDWPGLAGARRRFLA